MTLQHSPQKLMLGPSTPLVARTTVPPASSLATQRLQEGLRQRPTSTPGVPSRVATEPSSRMQARGLDLLAGRTQWSVSFLAAGNGARGIVYGTNGTEAHVWNAIVQRGRVNFIDFQGIGPNGRAAFDQWDSFAFVRTG